MANAQEQHATICEIVSQCMRRSAASSARDQRHILNDLSDKIGNLCARWQVQHSGSLLGEPHFLHIEELVAKEIKRQEEETGKTIEAEHSHSTLQRCFRIHRMWQTYKAEREVLCWIPPTYLADMWVKYNEAEARAILDEVEEHGTYLSGGLFHGLVSDAIKKLYSELGKPVPEPAPAPAPVPIVSEPKAEDFENALRCIGLPVTINNTMALMKFYNDIRGTQ